MPRSLAEVSLVLGIVLFPLQAFSPGIAASRYDSTAFIILSLGLYGFVRGGRIPIRASLFLIAFVGVQCVLLVTVGTAPLDRFLSGLVWFGGLLVVWAGARRVHYRSSLARGWVLAVVTASSIVVLLERFFTAERPKAFFAEPSYAGLAFYAAAAGVLFELLVGDRASRQGLRALTLLLLLPAAFSTLSMHLFTFSAVLAFQLVLSAFASPRPRRRALVTAVGLVLLAALTLPRVLANEHFAARLYDEDNPSLLAWLAGLDQARFALEESPIVGLGLGSTGEFEHYSPSAEALAGLGLRGLNARDAYSLGFRLTIETGLLVVLAGVTLLLRRWWMINRRSGHLSHAVHQPGAVFLMGFSTTVLVGALLKEPLYAQSHLYLAVFFLGSQGSSSAPVTDLPPGSHGQPQ